jgi:hypothetical protein
MEDPQTRFLDCTFDRARFGPDVRLYDARFERCHFTNVKLRGWRSFHAEFVDCIFTGQLRDCWFTGMTKQALYPKRDRNEFRGNDFRAATLISCQFDYGIDVHAQTWPSAPEYVVLDRFHERVTKTRAAVASWTDDQARENALGVLRLMADKGMDSQDAQILRREDWLTWAPVVRDRLFELLEAQL